MKEYYSEFTGLDRTTNPPDAPQVSFLIFDNYLNNRIKGGPVKRPGSVTWSATGDILGIFGYSDDSGSYRVPNVAHVLRHRRDGSTSYIEKLNWSASTWGAITQGANTSFGTAGIGTAAQYGDVLTICAGRPAKITDIASGNVNRLGGSAPASAPSIATAAGSLTGRTVAYLTFYDSTTGWESSPSPTSSITLTGHSISWSSLPTTADREGVDKKRLYRTQLAAEGSGVFYRVTEVSLATTTYADSTTDANLTTPGPDEHDHDAPPTTSYICAEYANCFWIASGNALYYSKAYDGTNVSLEYFSPDRVFYFPKQITGLAYSPEFGKLLVFCAAGYGIHQISGRSTSTFAQDVFKHTEGTNFPTSIAIHENLVAYWGANGPATITNAGIVHTFAEDMKDLFRAIAVVEYNSDVYVWAVWHSVYNKFIFGFAATDTGTAAWEDPALGTDVDWEDLTTGAVVGWG